MATPAAPSPSFLYVLELQCGGVAVAASINGVTITEEPAEVQKIGQYKLNPWIVDGPNTIVVHAAAALPGKKVPDKHLVAYLFAGPHGQQPAEEAALAKFAPGKALQVMPGALQPVWTHEFRPTVTFGRWAWQDADVVSMTASDAESIVTLLSSFRNALDQAQADRVTSMLAVRIQDLSRALGIPQPRVESNVAAAAAAWKPAEGGGPRLTPDALALKPAAGGRVVEITRADGSPVLTQATAGPFSDRRFYVSRVRGDWTIVR